MRAHKFALLLALAGAAGCTSTAAIKQEVSPLAERIGALEKRVTDLSGKLGEPLDEPEKVLPGQHADKEKGTGGLREKLSKLLPGKKHEQPPEDGIEAAVKRLEETLAELRKCCCGKADR